MMSKKPLIVFSTDWHLESNNITAITDLVRQQCELAKSLEVKYIGCLGDVFNSRIAQREEILTAFGRILDIISSYDLELWLIPGNHDKTVYTGFDSFLNPYKHHPCLKLIDKAGGIPFNDIYLHFLPFFSEEVWLNQFDELCKYIVKGGVDSKHILCTHIAVNGSMNNDKTVVSCGIKTSMFKDFFKVFSGHYHDPQTIGTNFYHLPSIQQNNFGENTDKGFTVLFQDGVHETVKSKFKEYLKVKIDLDVATAEDLTALKKKYKGNDNNIRFEFIGSESLLKSLKKEDFTSLGIDVKTKVKEIEADIEFSESEEVVEHTKDTIKDEFVKFCEKEGLDLNKGLKYLNKKLNGSK
jgi:exonuclease SbcD